ncbi:MAG: protease complex subunit PrcB family protein, partial [Thermodesulfobacteriota bacterium]
HMGTQKSTGYSIEITELTAFDDHIRARVVSRVPGRNCRTGSALTHPYHLVRIPKTDKDIIFSEKRIVHSCE